MNAFIGTVSGFGGVKHTNHIQFIDLTSVTFTSGQIHLSYTFAAGSGTLFVSSGVANFSAKADSNGNVEILDPTVPNGGRVEPVRAKSFPSLGSATPRFPAELSSSSAPRCKPIRWWGCKTCYNFFMRWRRAGVWDRIIDAQKSMDGIDE